MDSDIDIQRFFNCTQQILSENHAWDNLSVTQLLDLLPNQILEDVDLNENSYLYAKAAEGHSNEDNEELADATRRHALWLEDQSGISRRELLGSCTNGVGRRLSRNDDGRFSPGTGTVDGHTTGHHELPPHAGTFRAWLLWKILVLNRQKGAIGRMSPLRRTPGKYCSTHTGDIACLSSATHGFDGRGGG
ncbi:hypothetical protein EVAR_19109_1 [Eumeta japonica]|uniref:Uncharacterized protein n=1 Tax=Eumeta variegata TaxID=151549 RepID=A0A4C1UP94_EUMVA|nr:hypothetical protein EVAR_19109_1 [Eumeta japonica]